jgi:hypothetical protein
LRTGSSRGVGLPRATPLPHSNQGLLGATCRYSKDPHARGWDPGTDELVEAPAVVAWINPDEPTEVEALPPGCGLRFDGLEDDVAQAISAMVEDYLSIPRVLPPWFERPSDPTAS